MNSDTASVKKAAVIFDTRYGNTEKVAKALAKGMQRSPIEVACFNISDVQTEALARFDLLAIGAPTHYRTASKPMKDFLDKLERANLRGKRGFAFDTRVESFWAGSAAKFIENKMKALGVQIVKPHSSAMIRHPEEEEEESREAETGETKEERRARRAKEKEEKRAKVVLEEGTEQLFEKIGIEIGEILSRS
jgi:flavorubredoxin